MTDLGHLEVERDGDEAVGRLAGEIDLSNAAVFGERLRAAASGADRLILDLGEVTYFDSAGVRLLDELAGAGTLRVVAPPGSRAGTTLRICAFPADLVFESLDAARR